MIFRGGSIILVGFLQNIKDAYDRDREMTEKPAPGRLLQRHHRQLPSGLAGSGRIAVTHGIPVPAFASELAYYDSNRSEKIPANLLQERDYFGAHTFKRVDGEDTFHC
jgi:6-phosphogluconate dehydrogenase